MIRFLVCVSVFIFQFTNVHAFTDAQIKLMKEVQQACRTKTNSLDRSICQSDYRVKLVEDKCGRSAQGVVEGSIEAGIVKCGPSAPNTTPQAIVPKKKIVKKEEAKPKKEGSCAYGTGYACEAYEFRMKRCMQSSNDKDYCKDLSHKFALKAQVHEEMGDAGIKIYDNCLNMKGTSPDECVKFAKFYLDEAKKKREVAAESSECSEFAVGDQNVNCHGYEYKRVDSDMADVTRRLGKDVIKPATIRKNFGGEPIGARDK